MIRIWILTVALLSAASCAHVNVTTRCCPENCPPLENTAPMAIWDAEQGECACMYRSRVVQIRGLTQ